MVNSYATVQAETPDGGENINTRIKEIRLKKKMTQEEMGAVLGVTGAAFSRWETGDREIPDIAIRALCREFSVSEEWLRYGTGDMYAAASREEELGRLVRRLLSASPASFQAACITTLLRFDPEGPEWALVEQIYNSLAAELEKSRASEETRPAPGDSAEQEEQDKA